MPVTVHDDGSITSDGRNLVAALDASIVGLQAKRADVENEIDRLADRRDAGATERVRRLTTQRDRLREREGKLVRTRESQERAIRAHRGVADGTGKLDDGTRVRVEGGSDGSDDLPVPPRLRSDGDRADHSLRGDDDRLRSIRTNRLSGSTRGKALAQLDRWEGGLDEQRARLADLVIAAGPEHDPAAEAFARQVELTSSEAYRSAFRQVIAEDHPILTAAEAVAMREARTLQRALSLIDSAGGYLVPAPLDPAVMLDDPGSQSPIRALSRKVTATADTWRGVTGSSVSWSFDAEATEVSADDPTYGEVLITIRTARGFVPFSLEVAMDAVNFESELIRQMMDGREALENAVLLDGVAASNEPIGILTALVAAGGSIIVQTAGIGSVTAADVSGLYQVLPPRWQDSSTWVMSGTIAQLIASFTNPSDVALPPIVTSLVGRPVRTNSAMSTVTTANSYLAILGAWSNYIIADRVGTTVQRVPHLFGAAGRPTGQSGLFAFYRVGANVGIANAFRVLRVRAA